MKDGTPRDHKTIGWEAEVIGKLMIYTSFKFSAGLGYLWAGNGLDLQRTATSNFEPKKPWQLTTNLISVCP